MSNTVRSANNMNGSNGPSYKAVCIGMISILLILSLISNPSQESHLKEVFDVFEDVPHTLIDEKLERAALKQMHAIAMEMIDNNQVFHRMMNYHNWYVFSYTTDLMSGDMRTLGFFGMVIVYWD